MTSEAIVADDAYADPRTCEFAGSYLTSFEITAMLDIPIRVHGRLDGVLCHEQVGPAVPWTPEDRMFAIAIANVIALTIEEIRAQAGRGGAARERAKARDAGGLCSRCHHPARRRLSPLRRGE